MKRQLCFLLANLLAAQSVLALPGSSPDRLGDSFSNLKKFAREAEIVQVDAQIERDAKDLAIQKLVEAKKDLGLAAEVAEITDVRLGAAIPVNVEIHDAQLQRYIKNSLTVLRAEIGTLINGLASLQHYDSVKVIIDRSPFPYIDSYNVRAKLNIQISMGTFAFAQNKDELAASIASALTKQNPNIYLIHDDPRILRRLNDQLNFDGLSSETRNRLRLDISVMERLRGANLRPWGLTDFELRTFTYFREVYAKASPLRIDRLVNAGQNGEGFYTDPLFETRILTQKIVASYMQDRENLRELIAKITPFDPETKRLHQRAQHYVRSQFRAFRTVRAVARWSGAWLSVPMLLIADATGLLPTTLQAVSDLTNGSANLIGLGENENYRYVEHAIRTSAANLQNHFNRVETSIYHGLQVGLDEFIGVIIPVGTALKDLMYATLRVIEVLASLLGTTCLIVYDSVLGPVLHFTFHAVGLAASEIWHLLTLLAGFIHADIFDPIYNYFLHPIYAHSNGRVIVGALGVAGAAAIYKYTPPSTKEYWAKIYKRVHNRTGRTAHQLLYRSYGDWFFEELRLLDDNVDPKKLIGVARDLNRIYNLIFISYQYDFPWDSLQYLSKFNVGPKQYMRFTTKFLEAVRHHVENQHLASQDLTTILTALSPNTPDLNLERSEKRFSSYQMIEDNLVDQLFRVGSAHRPMRRLYESIWRRFPLPTQNSERVRTLADFNDTSIDAPHFLGLARILHDVEALIQNFDVESALRLNHTLYNLRAFPLLNWMNEKNFAAASQTVFVSGTTRETSDIYLRAILKARAIDVHTDTPGRTGWPMFDLRLNALTTQYLINKNVGAAAAAASWQSEVVNTFGARRAELKASLVRSITPSLAIKTAVKTALSLKLAQCQDIQQLALFFDNELLKRGMDADAVAARAYKEVEARPELLRTSQDIEALIAHDFFWPTTSPASNFAKIVSDNFNELLRKFRSIEAPLVQQLEKNRANNPGVWRYDPIASSHLQALIVARLESLHVLPQTYLELKSFWRRLTDRGVTPTSDRLLHRLIAMVPQDDIADLQRNIVSEHRVWESDLHSRVVIASVTGSGAYQELLKTPPDDATTHKREGLLDYVVSYLGSLMQERGLTYIQFLEDLSNQIVSTYPEAKIISQAKGAALDKANQPTKDENLEGLREVFKSIRNWPRADQFNLLLVLRDNAKPSGRVVAAFPRIGLERVRRMYEILPVAARVGVLDTFFTLSLVRQDKQSSKWVRQLTEHIVGGQKSESQKISLQILTGFLYAINEVGNGNLATTVLSYLYSLPSSATASPGEILKRVLEVFGATGIKLGQFLYASQILPEAEAKHLQSLQDRARVPTRIELYEDIYDILGLPSGSPLPFAVLELLGAASMKYAVRGLDLSNLQQVVLKIFRLDAKNNVDLQFDVLERTAKFLVANYGERYGVLEVVIDSARQAVKREGSLQNEIRRSQIARKYIYQDRVRSSVHFACPREALINSRLIIAEYADGVAFQDVPDELKPNVARALLELEADNMFGDHKVIRFDPDRHAGNFRVYIRPAGGDELEVSVEPFTQNNQIDFGQLLRMRREQRDLIIQLFAIAQIAGKAGANEWAIDRLVGLLSLTEVQRGNLEVFLRRYLKASQRNPVTTYVATLAALKRSGFYFENSTYLDFIRGIIQLTPYEKFAPDFLSSTKIFEQRVYAAVQDELKAFRFDSTQLKQIQLYNSWQKMKSYFNDKPATLLPTRAEEIQLNQFIRRELDCESNLDAS